MLAHRSGWPLFRMAKEGPGNLTTNVSKYEESENQVHQKQYLQPIITQYFIDNKSEIWLLFLIAHSKR